MNAKYKKRVPKVLPVGIAMGILFGASPIASPLTENTVKADVDTAATIITTFGKIYDAFLAEPFGKWLEKVDAESTYKAENENTAYKAPTFQKGEFGISAFDYYKDKNFSKNVKLLYPDGKFEYKTIKHGEQIRIKQAGTIVDLNPDEPALSKHDLLYITQKQLDEGKTGVSLTNFKTYYLQSNNSGRRNYLAEKYLKEKFPNAYLDSGLLDVRFNEDDLFKKLPEEKRILGTITSEPVGKDVLSNYVTNDSKALEDFKAREESVLADTKLSLDTPIALPFITLHGGENYKIIPYKKGSKKVVVKKGSQYLSGKEGNNLQYSDSIGDDELFELVQIENSYYDEPQFRLNNKNGVSLAGNQYIAQFGTDFSFKSEIRFTAKNNNEIHNWLKEWYPGKENEKQKYDGIQIVTDEKDPKKWTAKDSSGNVIKNSWVNQGSNYYYAGSDGVFLTGWHEIEGKKYYFHPDHSGAIVSPSGSNGDNEIDGKYYHFDDKGALQRSAWKGQNYSDESGAFFKDGLREIDGKIYYFQDYVANTKEIRLEDQNILLHFSAKGALEKASKLNGEALGSITHVTFNEKQFVFERDGSIRKSGVSKIFLPALFDEKDQPLLVYYSFEEGPDYSGWKEIDGKKYYFESGKNYNFDRNVVIDGKKYYFNQEGEVLPTGFIVKDAKTYYYNDKGVMQTGGQKINGDTYYFSTDTETLGQMQSYIFFTYDGKKYYAGSNGAAMRNADTVVRDTKRDTLYYIYTNSEGHLIDSWIKK
ncbi:N-acetylmuramoyl-L-alanine amidase family protein [Bacillus cereus group sp. BfR-BA-01310]|uniref:N-acetylmuramoyl-L-alanine amidase family protein n=1 Tax=Bacillus cereus group sp. BfR-BA-01310 TaxID=2920287 RepID=UPI001F590836|nr:cell wall-binding protein [Bacillus cereus group sp. BfR-BA-01310]